MLDKLLCWVFGHRWLDYYRSDVTGIHWKKVCARCGFIKERKL